MLPLAIEKSIPVPFYIWLGLIALALVVCWHEYVAPVLRRRRRLKRRFQRR